MKTMNIVKYTMSLLLVPLVLFGCYANPGRSVSSDKPGYDHYTNKAINVSVLTPVDWSSDVSTGGVYTITSPKPLGAQIYVMRTPVVNFMGEGSLKSTSLEEFREFRLSQITVEEIGPELDSTIQKSSLAGDDAYELRYSYKSAIDEQKWFVREIFAVIDGNVYMIQSYTRNSTDPELLKTFEIMKDSYRILNR